VERQNVTISVPKDVLRKAKHLAINRQTSLSGLMTETLKDLVNREESYQKARSRQLSLLDEGMELGLQGNIKWTREEIHER